MKKGHHLFQIVSFFDLSLLASVNKVSILNAFKGLLYRHTPNAKGCFQRVEKVFSPRRGAGIHRRPNRFPCALPTKTGGATGRKNLFFPLPLLSELVKVLIIFDFNGAGKQAKRRQWRMKQACFEEGSQTADTKYPLFGLSRQCIPSWVSRAHLSFPLRKSLLAALHLFPLLGLSPR